jgi:hypothetical protein
MESPGRNNSPDYEPGGAKKLLEEMVRQGTKVIEEIGVAGGSS